MTFSFEYIPYIFAILVILIIIFFTYLRVKYGFWYHQPVHHIYDTWYYFFPPGIIQHSLPESNKYTNFKQIQTKPFEKLSPFEISQFTAFIRNHFLKNGENIFTPTKENIGPYFTGFTQPAFFSFFYEPIVLLDTKDKNLVEDKKIIAVMTSRPLTVYLNDNSASNNKKNTIFDVYYVDYLCVHMDYRKKGTAPQIIQTHEYNQRHLNKNISVSLFKREGDLTGIVPICVYDMLCFDCVKLGKPVLNLYSSYNIIQTGKTNVHLLVDFLKTCINIFDLFIIPEVANLNELIKTNNLHIYFLLQDKEIIAAYFFRKSCTFMEEGREILTLIASIDCCENTTIFIQGFKMAYWEIIQKNSDYNYVVIEEISHNNHISKELLNVLKPELTLPAAYFFYNFAYKSFMSNKVFIAN